MSPQDGEGNYWADRLSIVSRTRFFFIALFGALFQITRSWYKTEADRKILEQSRLEAEMQNLKSQLNPHFLFNTLNNIYSLIAISQEKAQSTLYDLSRLLHYVLYDSSQQEISVQEEFNFIRKYVHLMSIRLPEHVEVKTVIEAESPQITIAPLLFISLIENAFKHGVSNDDPSFITIDLHQKEDEITCHIINSYFPKDTARDKSGSGIGLSNLEKRLELLYRGQYTLSYGKEGALYRTDLSIHIKQKTS